MIVVAKTRDKKHVDGEKLFIVKKFVKAVSAAEAIKKERKIEPHDVYVDTDWTNGKSQSLAEAIGFSTSSGKE